jgi:hypothetical protein
MPPDEHRTELADDLEVLFRRAANHHVRARHRVGLRFMAERTNAGDTAGVGIDSADEQTLIQGRRDGEPQYTSPYSARS